MRAFKNTLFIFCCITASNALAMEHKNDTKDAGPVSAEEWARVCAMIEELDKPQAQVIMAGTLQMTAQEAEEVAKVFGAPAFDTQSQQENQKELAALIGLLLVDVNELD